MNRKVLINDTFHLSPNEVRRQGIGNFHGNETIGGNETIKVTVGWFRCFCKEFLNSYLWWHSIQRLNKQKHNLFL